MREFTEELFLKNVSKHVMTILRDDGVHRHVRFKQPDSSNMYFDIVTYPHFLVYSGDMGCYVFSRINDMFEFFRGKSEGPLRINESYWAEKLEATDRQSGQKEYSADRFRKYVADRLEQIKEAQTIDADSEDEGQSVAAAFDEFELAVKDNVLAYADDGDLRAHQALDEFEHEGNRWFSDSWEANFDEYTFRFVWCCYALAWAIRQYDKSKQTALSGGV